MMGLKTLVILYFSIFLLVSCEKDSVMSEDELKLKYADADKPFDFISIEFLTKNTNHLTGEINLWIKNKPQETTSLDDILNSSNIKYKKNGIYYIIDDFKEFTYRGVDIKKNGEDIFLNNLNLNEFGNATLSEKDELTMGSFYPTFY